MPFGCWWRRRECLGAYHKPSTCPWQASASDTPPLAPTISEALGMPVTRPAHACPSGPPHPLEHAIKDGAVLVDVELAQQRLALGQVVGGHLQEGVGVHLCALACA